MLQELSFPLVTHNAVRFTHLGMGRVRVEIQNENIVMTKMEVEKLFGFLDNVHKQARRASRRKR